jgi:hypothetical protein
MIALIKVVIILSIIRLITATTTVIITMIRTTISKYLLKEVVIPEPITYFSSSVNPKYLINLLSSSTR